MLTFNKRLLELGADINLGNVSDSCTALALAATNGHSEIVSQLLERGANPNSANTKGLIPLHFAASMGHKRVAELLIAGGSKLDEKTVNKLTPLHFASTMGRIEVARLINKYINYTYTNI